MTKSDEIMREVREEVERQEKAKAEKEAEFQKRDKIIFGAISFLLGAVDLGIGATESQLEAMRIHHINQLNTLIYDKKDLVEKLHD